MDRLIFKGVDQLKTSLTVHTVQYQTILFPYKLVITEKGAYILKRIEKFFMLLLSPVWPVYTLFKTSWKQFYSEAYSTSPKKDLEEIEKLINQLHTMHTTIPPTNILIQSTEDNKLHPIVSFVTLALPCSG